MDATLYLVKILWINFFLIKCSSYECSNRYEFKEEIKKALPDLNNCTIVKRRYPVCDRTVTVYYTQHPPYVDKKTNTTEPHGLIPGKCSMYIIIRQCKVDVSLCETRKEQIIRRK